jgi:hypothetical protein
LDTPKKNRSGWESRTAEILGLALISNENPYVEIASKRRFTHGFYKGTGQFPIQKWAISCKFKENQGIARRHTLVRRASDDAELSAFGVFVADPSRTRRGIA